MHHLKESEFILNPDGSIYHLNCFPEDIADTIIFVGDPNRVVRISKHFDRIEIQKTKREFVTHTGYIGDLRLTVISTGISTDNIDIVLNELDALVNVDFKNRTIKDKIKKLKIIRLGTCGGLQESVPIGSVIVSDFAIGLDGLMSYYASNNNSDEDTLLKTVREKLSELPVVNSAYVAAGASSLTELFQKTNQWLSGITITCVGFYGPQYRNLRAQLSGIDLFSLASEIQFKNLSVMNLEMETAGIYGLSRLLGHEACSISTVIANRSTRTMSSHINQSVDKMIESALAVLTHKS